jgi:hypothetical protein
MFRRALDVDDGTWNRARGFALHQAAMIIPYYGVTNPGFVALAKRTVEEILADISAESTNQPLFSAGPQISGPGSSPNFRTLARRTSTNTSARKDVGGDNLPDSRRRV